MTGNLFVGVCNMSCYKAQYFEDNSRPYAYKQIFKLIWSSKKPNFTCPKYLAAILCVYCALLQNQLDYPQAHTVANKVFELSHWKVLLIVFVGIILLILGKLFLFLLLARFLFASSRKLFAIHKSTVCVDIT